MKTQKQKFGVGLHDGVPAEIYHADPCPKPSLSASLAHIIISRSPRRAWRAHPRLNKKFKSEEKEKFDLGSAAHSYIIENNKAAIEVIDAEDWRSKEVRELRDAARATGKMPILAYQMAGIKNMAEEFHEAIDECEYYKVRDAFTRGKAEQTAIWKEGKLWFRSRNDWLTDNHDLILDYKTTELAEPESFIRGPMVNLGYDMKAAFYLRGLRAVSEQARNITTDFIWIVQETSEPYDVSFVGYTAQMEETAERKVARAIQLWGDCLKSKSWPGYTRRVAWASLPSWAIQRFEEYEAMQGFITSSEQLA